MGDDDRTGSSDLLSEALNMMDKRDAGQKQDYCGPGIEEMLPEPSGEPASDSGRAEKPYSTPSQGEELSLDAVHALGMYKSRYCRDMLDVLENHSKYRKSRIFGSDQVRPEIIRYVQRSLALVRMHPAKRLGMVRKAIFDSYFRGYDITPLLQRLDEFCVHNSVDDKVYGRKADQKNT